MRTSEICINAIKGFEGCELESYQDSVGIWTIGWGHTKEVSPNQSISLTQAEEYLKSDLVPCELAINRLIHSPLTQWQFDACVSLSYNIGIGNFTRSTLLSLIHKGDISQASREFLRWDKAEGKTLPGLTTRRNWEMKRFLNLI